MKNNLLKTSLFAVALWVTGGLGGELFASDFPSMPSIDSPSMPSLSSPSSGPATPWRGGAPYIPSQASPAQQQSADKSDSTDTKDTAAGLALTAQSISGLGGLEALESLSGSLGGLGGLGELSGLGGLEGLSGLGGLNGVDALKSLEALKNLEDEDDLKKYLSALSGSSGLDTKALEEALEKLQERADSTDTAKAAADTPSGSASDEGTAATLQQILRQLEILAAQRDVAQQESSQEPVKTENLSPSRILRFRANATDLLPTCTTVYFSQPDPAGAFLLTGDRLVKAGGKERNETFYFLFTPTLNQEGSFIYQVEAQLMQDWPTERSELYPLTTSLPLTATRTGNLVALRHTSDSWTLDLLLDLREGE